MFKIVQKQTYTFLSHRYGMLLIFSGVILIIVSAFQFGEVAIEWSQDRYSRLFNIYHDNIANKAFENRMCLPIPIDAVYTWVNGSDEKLLKDLAMVTNAIEQNAVNTTDSTSSFQCRLKDCIPASLLMTNPLLDRAVSIEQLGAIEGGLLKVTKISNVTKEAGKTNTMLQFSSQEEVEAVTKAIQRFTLNSKNYTLSKGYLTSDFAASGSVALTDRVLLTGAGKDTTKDEVKTRLGDQYQDYIGEIFVDSVAGVAIAFITNPDKVTDLVSDAEKTNTSSTMKVAKAYLVWNLEHEESKPDEDYAANRFEDNEELRYSLRSIEKHAPWIRRVYIITNGQIPAWLNLDNPRLILVSHDEIFPNKSHLPSFSSPAIESHVHRIPGLSKKFIYLNDDTMFGKDIWPDDFYTHASGQKVYLTWPVPNCAEGCPSSWIKDNYCDKACNNSECEWDGGDCDGVAEQGRYAAGIHAGGVHMEQMYCNTGCANGWVADKYCDQACNVPSCGFDAGDCGKGNFKQLFSVLVSRNRTQINLPKGLEVAYFNVTPIFGKGSTITDGKYDNRDIVRAATIAQKFKTVHLLLYKNMSEANITFRVTGKDKDDHPLNVTFIVTVNTKENKNLNLELIRQQSEEREEPANEMKEEPVEPTIQFHDISEERRGPKVPLAREKDISLPFEPKEEDLTEDIASQLKDLTKQLEDGEITQKGYDRLRANMLAQYMMSPAYNKHRREVAFGQEGKIPDAGQRHLPDAGQGPIVDTGKREIPGAGEGQRGHIPIGQVPAGHVFDQVPVKQLPGRNQPIGQQGVGQGQIPLQGQGLYQGLPAGRGGFKEQGGEQQQQIPGAQFGNQQVQGQGIIGQGQMGNQQAVYNQIKFGQGQAGLEGGEGQAFGQGQLGQLPLGDIQGKQQFNQVPANQGQFGQYQGQDFGLHQQQGQVLGILPLDNGEVVGQQGQGFDQVPLDGQQGQGFAQAPLGQNQGQLPFGQQVGVDNGQVIGQQQVGVDNGQVIGQQGQGLGHLPLGGRQEQLRVGQQQVGVDNGQVIGQQGQGLDHLPLGGRQGQLPVQQQGLGMAGAQQPVQQKDNPAEHLNVEADAFDDLMFGFKSLKNDKLGQVVPPGGINTGQDKRPDARLPGQGIPDAGFNQDVGNAALQGKQFVDQKEPQMPLQQVLNSRDQMRDTQLKSKEAMNGEKEPLEGGGMGIDEFKRDKELFQDGNIGQLDQEQGQDDKLKVARDKYRHIADEFDKRKGNKVQNNAANLKDTKNWKDADHKDKLRQPVEKANQGIGGLNGVNQQLFDAKPLGGVGEDLQPVVDINDNLNQPIGDQDKLHQPIGDQDKLHQPVKVEEGEGFVKLPRGETNQVGGQKLPKDYQDDHRVGNLLKEHNNLPFQIHDAAEVNFDDVQANNQGNQGDNDVDNEVDNGGMFHQRDAGFRRLLANDVVQEMAPSEISDTIAANMLVNRDNHQNVNIEDLDNGSKGVVARGSEQEIFVELPDKLTVESKLNSAKVNVDIDIQDALRTREKKVGKAVKISMRISDGAFDHELIKKPKQLGGQEGQSTYMLERVDEHATQFDGNVKEAHNQSKQLDNKVMQSEGKRNHETVETRLNQDTVALAIDEDEALKIKEEKDRKSSFLPWERTDNFNNLTKILERQETMEQYLTQTGNQRHLLDTFGDSLRHVNKLYNKKFGYQARKVPAHMPHMIDVGIMSDLQAEFAEEYDITSSHKLRHPRDMQYAFSYFYYLMGTPKIVNVTEVFDEFDTDKSGVLSDREIRTLATRLFDLPLDLKTLTSLEGMIIKCAENVSEKLTQPAEEAIEKYYEDKMPQVTKDLVMHCPPLVEKMQGSVKGQTMYKYEIMGEDEIAFKMIHTNVSQVIGQLDDIRKNPKKFVCLNDNIDHKNSDAYMVKAVLQDFYESLFPIPSQFELAREYRNRFLHIDELREWRRYRDWLRFWTHLSLGTLITFSIVSFCSSHLLALKRRCFGRRRWFGSRIAETVQHV